MATAKETDTTTVNPTTDVPVDNTTPPQVEQVPPVVPATPPVETPAVTPATPVVSTDTPTPPPIVVTTDTTSVPNAEIIKKANAGHRWVKGGLESVTPTAVLVRNITSQKQTIEVGDTLYTFNANETKSFDMVLADAEKLFSYWVEKQILKIKN